MRFSISMGSTVGAIQWCACGKDVLLVESCFKKSKPGTNFVKSNGDESLIGCSLNFNGRTMDAPTWLDPSCAWTPNIAFEVLALWSILVCF
jgi:hypothetical protein